MLSALELSSHPCLCIHCSPEQVLKGGVFTFFLFSLAVTMVITVHPCFVYQLENTVNPSCLKTGCIRAEGTDSSFSKTCLQSRQEDLSTVEGNPYEEGQLWWSTLKPSTGEATVDRFRRFTANQPNPLMPAKGFQSQTNMNGI